MSFFPIFILCLTHPPKTENLLATNQNRARNILNFVGQSESGNTPPDSSAYENRVLRHLRALGWEGGPFLALGSSWLARAYLIT